MIINWLEKGAKYNRIVEKLEKNDGFSKEQSSIQDKPLLVTPDVRKLQQRLKRVPKDRRIPLIAEQVMTSPVIMLEQDDTLEQARSIILENRFHNIPVISNQNRLIGILSDGDIFCRSSTGECFPFNTDLNDKSPKVTDLMVKRVLVGNKDTQIPYIARVLIEEQISVMPIIDDKDFPIGMITRSDILKTLVFNAPLDQWI